MTHVVNLTVIINKLVIIIIVVRSLPDFLHQEITELLVSKDRFVLLL